MLKSLIISNFALIDHLEISFFKGFNIITGETGAGKSILLGALSLIMGQRADLGVIQDKDKKTVVEGVFDLTQYKLESFFSDYDLDYDEHSVLRRELTSSGKSRAFINDTPVTLKILQKLAYQLIDIHSQHENLDLNRSDFQMNVVDTVAGNHKVLATYHLNFSSYKKIETDLKNLVEKADQAKSDLDYFQFQYGQLEEAELKEGEQEQLEQELETLEHAEEIKMALNELNLRMEDETGGILLLLKEELNKLQKIAGILPEAGELFKRIDSTYIELSDIANEFNSLEERTELDPQRILLIRERLDLVYSLEQKYRVNSVEELLAVQEDFNQKIQQIASFDDEIHRLEAEKNEVFAELQKQAEQLRQSRYHIASSIETEVCRLLKQLGMVNSVLKIHFEALESPVSTGIDRVNFLFSANKNGDLKDIAQVASGGELSRVMLALKSILARSRALPTIIFDEIDTGISGEVAVKMGAILRKMSEGVQLLNITHLPQIAAQGNHHFMVYKFDRDDRTYSSIRELNPDERVEELAQMVGGKPVSDTARETAKELLRI